MRNWKKILSIGLSTLMVSVVLYLLLPKPVVVKAETKYMGITISNSLYSPTGFSYRKELTITGSPDGAQKNYQKKLIINRSTGTDFPDCQKWIVVTTGSGSHYEYRDMADVTDYTLQSGDYLEYDIYWTSSSDFCAFDFVCTDNSTLRDWAGVVDQNGLGVHPAIDISAYANGAWYSRVIAIPAGMIGKTVNRYLIATDGAPNSSTKSSYLKNIRITNGSGTVRKFIADKNEDSYLLTSYDERGISSYSFVASPASVYVGTKCLENYNDIRFTNSDGDTLLDYWIESSNSSSATIWVEFDSIGTSTSTFYLYYGNSGASSYSSGANTFIFFDDFSGDLSAWSSMPAEWAIVSGRLESDTSNEAGKTISDATNLRCQAILNPSSNFNSARRLKLLSSGDTDYMSLWFHPSQAGVQLIKTGEATAGKVSETISASTDYKLALIKLSSTWKLSFDGSIVQTKDSWLTLTLASFRISAESSAITYWDNILLSNITTNEPVLTTWGGEEAIYNISNTPSTKGFGIVVVGTSYYAYGSAPSNPVQDGECIFTITNNGAACDLDMKISDFTGGVGWNIVSVAPGSDEARITVYYSGQNPTNGLVLSNTDAEFYDGLASSSTIKWDFKIETGSSFGDGVEKTATITITAVAED